MHYWSCSRFMFFLIKRGHQKEWVTFIHWKNLYQYVNILLKSSNIKKSFFMADSSNVRGIYSSQAWRPYFQEVISALCHKSVSQEGFPQLLANSLIFRTTRTHTYTSNLCTSIFTLYVVDITMSAVVLEAGFLEVFNTRNKYLFRFTLIPLLVVKIE